MTATYDDELLGFDGEAFDPLLPAAVPTPPAALALLPGTATTAVAPAPLPGGADPAARLARRIRESVVAAHASALAAQEALQRLGLARLGGPPLPAPQTPHQTPTPAPAPPQHRVVRELPEPATTEGAFKPLARTPVARLTAADLNRLRAGDIAGVFGPAYDQRGDNPEIRLAAAGDGALTEVTRIARRTGRWNHGVLTGRCALTGPGGVTRAVEQAAQVLALYLGLHLCFADAAFTTDPGDTELDGAMPEDCELSADISAVDMIPRPWLTVEAELRAGERVVARVHGLRVEVRERPGVPIGPEEGGIVPRFLGRRNAEGEPAMLGEFHMIHSSRGDLAVTLGPEFARTNGRRATRMPCEGLRLCDRLMRVEGARHELGGGAKGWSEYDAHADSWYFLESANASMPNVIYMETSLQSALLLGYYLGATLTDPGEDYSLRNLDGTATVLREVDLRDKTIKQTSELLSTSVLSGAVLQSFAYELSVDGEPFYRGESLFGFFNEQALANQTGLDGGAYVPTWLERQDPRPQVRVIEAGRRAPGGPRAATGHMRLLDEVQVVDGGGEYGRGYLRAVRPIAESDWYFRRHFHLDPVMPGSLGVEAVIQAMQEWLVDSGLGDHLAAPEFVLPAGLPMTWRYRGQILAADREMTLDVHIKDVVREEDRVRVVADANVWKPGLRIYHIQDVGVELREGDVRS
ncbi:3-hydroxymyristoyl/3-hydroxydecanoyl-(acyl carrier protein) dehydratase [Thermocatellispora tengchongensis]|uniref:3-hydroxymyristoyl/3-hydroxydecanoyl-(Acyl carrier protein) dehydratase n=1 Tax=Thermocatellispora tengchongensis TaxID=1073253 RepID=A0A840PN48_9ACTN|nr:beta-hydroxydecanoyl-ACP dehydratase [Thermocatellispora tengchongensis]MBB5139211.1 3-hydroxymyristoyl/3-hydroxydecanoyl-(acyl carrier protein) dehydratase [Thermocatellispora tengchongensis]